MPAAAPGRNLWAAPRSGAVCLGEHRRMSPDEAIVIMDNYARKRCRRETRWGDLGFTTYFDVVRKRVVRSGRNFRGTSVGEAINYVKRILRRAKCDLLAKAAGRPTALPLDAVPEPAARDQQQAALLAKEHLDAALAKLPAELRQVVVLRAQGLTFEAIAAQVGGCRETVRKLHQRGSERLAELRLAQDT